MTILLIPCVHVCAGGIEAGATGAWVGLLTQILDLPQYSSQFAGVVGFVNGIAGMAGM